MHIYICFPLDAKVKRDLRRAAGSVSLPKFLTLAAPQAVNADSLGCGPRFLTLARER